MAGAASAASLQNSEKQRAKMLETFDGLGCQHGRGNTWLGQSKHVESGIFPRKACFLNKKYFFLIYYSKLKYYVSELKN